VFVPAQIWCSGQFVVSLRPSNTTTIERDGNCDDRSAVARIRRKQFMGAEKQGEFPHKMAAKIIHCKWKF